MIPEAPLRPDGLLSCDDVLTPEVAPSPDMETDTEPVGWGGASW
jgi:hypothetical protein